MIPHRTQDMLGSQVMQAITRKAHSIYSVQGLDLNDLKALAMRLDLPQPMDADERRDWANRINVLLDTADLELEQ